MTEFYETVLNGSEREKKGPLHVVAKRRTQIRGSGQFAKPKNKFKNLTFLDKTFFYAFLKSFKY